MNFRLTSTLFWPQLALSVAALALSGCNNLPGRPEKGSEVARPDEISDFNMLFKRNCSGCHGQDGKGAAAIALNNPVYLAIASDDVIRRTASAGVSGTPMVAFAQSKGGMLTDKQIDVIVRGIRSWARPDRLAGVNLPPYSAAPGNAQQGADVYATFCASCHGPKGDGGEKAGSIVDGSYLALVSNQQLRSIVIAGWPAVGAPDFRNNVPEHVLSPQDVSDVVAWLASRRTQFPGQPYPNSEGGAH
jgi:cytochrome c oxidase cbb3-type subunit III